MTARYNPVSIALHWLIALLIFGAFPLGLYMVDLPLSPQKLHYYSWHKWTGVTIFILALLRILWRLGHKPPAPVPMPNWQRLTAETVHYLLYACMVVIPLSGWLMSSAKGVQTVWFGLLPLPDLLTKNKELGHALEDVHAALNYGMLLLFGLHLAAALKHQFIDRDGLLLRMNPFARSQEK